MVLINPLDYMINFELVKYVFVAFAFYGLMLCLQKLILGKKV